MNTHATDVLTYDQKKAAEAAFRGLPFNPKWSDAARQVYDGILKAQHGCAQAESDHDTVVRQIMATPEPSIQPSDESIPSQPDVPSVPINGIQCCVIDVSSMASELGIPLKVCLSQHLYDQFVKSGSDNERYQRVRDILLVLRLFLNTINPSSQSTSQFSALVQKGPGEPFIVKELTGLFCEHTRSSDAFLLIILPEEIGTIPLA